MEISINMIFMFLSTLLLLCSSPSSSATTANPPSLSPTSSPAPSPAPDYVNLADLLTVAGPFHTFLSFLQSTDLIDSFQNQANNTDEGITIFVPKDSAFSSQKHPSLSKLTQEQIKQVILFHALPHFYSLSEFRNLSETASTPTFAGGGYTLNFSDVSGTVHISSGWSKTKVSSAVHATDPVAIYQIDKVLLPEAIFGTDIPPSPAPAPAPEISPAADSPTEEGTGSDKSSSSSSLDSSSSLRVASIRIWEKFVMAVIVVLVVLFL